jgi:hypothetical protein
MVGTSSESYPMADLDISGTELSGSAVTVLVTGYLQSNLKVSVRDEDCEEKWS